MDIRDDEQSEKLVPGKDKIWHTEQAHLQPWIGEKTMLPDIEDLEAMSPQEIRKIIQKQSIYLSYLERQNEKLERTINKRKGPQIDWVEVCNYAPVGHAAINEQGTILEANLTFVSLLGLSTEILINEKMGRFIIKEKQNLYLLFQKKLFETGKSRCKLCLKTEGSESFWVYFKGKIFRDEKSRKTIGLIMVLDIDKYKQAEKKLKESRDNLNHILDNSPVVIYSKDLSGKYTIINKKFEELSGLTRKEVIHKTDFELFPETVAVQSRKNDHKVIESTTFLETEEIAPVNGEMRTFLTAKYPMINSGGKVYGICGFSIDIENRKRAEEALRESEQKYRTLFEETSNPIMMVDENARYIDANKAALEFLKCDRQALLKKSIWDFVPPEKLEFVKKNSSPFMSRRTIEACYLVNGAIKTLLLNVIPFEIKGKTILYGIGQDITERKQYEKALENAKTQWEETFDAISDWVSIIDKDYRIICSNKASEKYFGLIPQDIVDKHCYEFVHGTDSPIFDCPLQKAIKDRQREEFEFQTENGRWWHVFVNPVESIKSNNSLTVHVVRDITDTKIKEQKVLSSRKAEAFRILAGGLSHDFNNLLTVIWGNIAILKNEMSSEIYNEYIRKLENACELSRSLTQKLVTLSMSKGAVINRSVCDIKKVLSMVVQVFLKTDNVNIFFDYPSVLPMIKLDLEQMLIVFQNIVENAAEAMPDGGSLNIKAEIILTEQDDQKDIKFLKISFEDTGIGIAEADLPKVFDPYFTTKAMGWKKGVGLGLATAQAIVARHGGDIYINSSIGKGTNVIVSLPLE